MSPGTSPTPSLCQARERVVPMATLRKNFHKIAAGLIADPLADPVIFGPHRKPVGVLMSYDHYYSLMSTIDDFARDNKKAFWRILTGGRRA